jgi:Protein of unknown function (DUF1295)
MEIGEERKETRPKLYQGRIMGDEPTSELLWQASISFAKTHISGESLLWTGTALAASRSLTISGVYPRYAGLLGFLAPAFVTILTQFVSGVPLLEEKMDKAGDKEWEKYKQVTPRFFPKMGSW